MDIDSTTIIAILTFLAPLIGYIVTYLKKKLGDTQGDMSFTTMKNWVAEAQNLAIAFPETKPYADDLEASINHAGQLWKDPANNSAELAQVFAHSSVLIIRVYDLIAKHATKPVTTPMISKEVSSGGCVR